MDTRFGIADSRERVRQLLHELEFRLHRLRYRHLKATPEEQAAFQAELEALLAEWPEDWERIVMDEATVRRHSTLTAQWCMVADVPEVPTADDHTQGHGYGAVAPLTGRTHSQVSPTLGKEAFAPFLPHWLVSYPRKRLLAIHDRGEPHQGAPVEAIVHQARDRLVLTPQPASSPELNPQARIWTWWRRVVPHHHGFATLQEPIEAIRVDFTTWLKPFTNTFSLYSPNVYTMTGK
jgi:hypothetical protein